MNYDAFISYSHKDCGNIAPAIQKAIENIGKPWYLLKRNLTVFRDETNLAATPELWNTIASELDNADNLILLASPIAQKSYWVNKELEYWFSKERTGKLYIMLCQGEIHWDYNSNDFNWDRTNSLPSILKNKFNQEPLWIDLSEFVNKDNLSINYKSPSFTSNLVKIVAGITGKSPREIESDELSRKRKTTAALFISSIFFITISLLVFFLYNQNQINKRNSIANNLIAEGNKFRETDINEALLKYAYAYKINPTAEIYTVISDFYNQQINDTITIDTIKRNYVLNKFFKKIYINDIKTKSEDEAIIFSRVFPTLKMYCVFKDGSLIFYDLNSNTKLFSKNIKNCTSISADGTSIMYETENNSLFVYQVDTKTIDTIAISGILQSNGQDVISEYEGYKYIQAYIKNSNIVIFQQSSDNSLKIRIGDVNGKKWNQYSVYNNSSGTQIGMIFYLINCRFDNTNKLLHYSSSIAYGNQYYNEEIRNFNYKDSIVYSTGKSFRDNYNYSVTSLFINDYFIIGLYSGKIEVHKELKWDASDGEVLRKAPETVDISKGLVDFVIYKDYLIGGYDNGKLNFYIAYGNNNLMNNDRLQFEVMPLAKSIILPPMHEIEKLDVYDDILFIAIRNGSLLKIPLTLIVKLDKNPNKLLEQVKKLTSGTD